MLKAFTQNCRGGVAPMMAMLALPLVGSVGVAVDFTSVNATRTAFQSALDATALMMAKTAAKQNSSDLPATATNYFNALFTKPGVSNIVVTPSYSTDGGSKLVLNGSATVATNFLGVLGYSSVNISAASTSIWGDTRLRVSLVLDNTGSMSSSNKMSALKTASQNLLTQLKDAATLPEDVYISVVPFSKDVNIGSDAYAESWISWSQWDEENGTCSNTNYKTQNSCTSHNRVWTPASHSTWNGCLTDRDQNFDTTNDAPVSGGTLYPAEQYSSCPVATLPLTNDWTALSSKIDAMQPSGNTNQAIGLQLGWQSLTASPFTVPPLDPNYKYNHVIIILTDGLNTEDRWYTNQSSIDAREQKTCDNIKATGVTIYTVQVNTGGDPTSALLQNCASDKTKFFLLTSSTQIITTFNQIGTQLSALRLAM